MFPTDSLISNTIPNSKERCSLDWQTRYFLLYRIYPPPFNVKANRKDRRRLVRSQTSFHEVCRNHFPALSDRVRSTSEYCFLFSTSFFGSGTRSLSDVRISPACGLSLSDVAEWDSGCSETPSPAPASGSACTSAASASARTLSPLKADDRIV